jgi:hypothetical protein
MSFLRKKVKREKYFRFGCVCRLFLRKREKRGPVEKGERGLHTSAFE